MGANALENLFDSLGFFQKPNLPLLVASSAPQTISQVDLAALGQADLSVSPLQMALAAAAFSNGGVRPAPQIASAFLSPQQGWTIYPHQPGVSTSLVGGTDKAATALTASGAAYWQTIALARSNQEELTWYLAGTLPQSQGTSLALALVLDQRNPELARQIGQSLLKTAVK